MHYYLPTHQIAFFKYRHLARGAGRGVIMVLRTQEKHNTKQHTKKGITGIIVQSIRPKRASRGLEESQQVTSYHSVLCFAHAKDTQNKNKSEKKLSIMFFAVDRFLKCINGALGLLQRYACWARWPDWERMPL